MAHTAASPYDLSLSLDDRVQDAEEIHARLHRLMTSLREGHPYYVDHAEEQLLDTATRCDELARRLRSLATYAVTGAARRQGVDN